MNVVEHLSHLSDHSVVWVLLTREDDQDGAKQQVDGRLPPLWHASYDWWYEDLRRDVELQGVSDEDAEAVEQLHGLVRPGDGERGKAEWANGVVWQG